MDTVNRKPKTMGRWEELLTPDEILALVELMDNPEPEAAFSPDEVLDAIVKWNGGMASGYQIRALIGRVYGVEL